MQQVNLPKQNNSNFQNTSLNNSVTNSKSDNKSPLNSINSFHNSRNNSNNQDDAKKNDRRVSDDSFLDPWGSSFGDPWGDDEYTEKKSKGKKLTPQERKEMITKVYQDVLGREPDTRDINYYKYSTLDENEIYKQILTGKEHKKLIADGKEYKKMSFRANQSELKVKMLEGQIKDQIVEFRQLKELLQEKNRYIQQLRSNSHNPYSFTTNNVDNVKLGHMHYSQEGSQSENKSINEAQTFNQNDSPNQSNVKDLNERNQTQESTHFQTGNFLNNQTSDTNRENIKFGNSNNNRVIPKKKNKLKEFIRMVLDI